MSAHSSPGGEFHSSTPGSADIITEPTDDAGEDSETTSFQWNTVTLADVHDARARISAYLHPTPLVQSARLSALTGTDFYLKPENLQRTGSYKVRGALNTALHLSDEQKQRGLVCLSAGNHGQGVAYAAQQVGSHATVFSPETAVPTKVQAMRGYGADVRFAPSMEDILPFIEKFRAETGAYDVSPYNDPLVVAGQGTIGLEILDELPDVENIVVAIGGGGMLSGILVAVKSIRPDVRVVGVEPEQANVMRRSLDFGKPMTAERPADTIADGLVSPGAGALSFAIIQHYVDDIVLVSEAQIADAVWSILHYTKLLAEPAGAAATAALLAGLAGVKPGSKTVAVLSGGNVDPAKLKSILPA